METAPCVIVNSSLSSLSPCQKTLTPSLRLRPVCLELVRQQASLQAAWSDSNHYRSSKVALRDFQSRSVANRSRYDQETCKSGDTLLSNGYGYFLMGVLFLLLLPLLEITLVSNFNAEGYNAETDKTQTIADGKATMAVVSIHFVSEGEDISHFKSMRADMVNLLRWTAATVPVSALLAGEVLWSPQRATDTLSRRDIDERYPELTPII